MPDSGTIEAGPDAWKPGVWGRLRRAVLGVHERETSPARRGFRIDDPAVGERLQRVGRTFLTGYHAALGDPRPEPLARHLDAQVEPGFRGWAYEGAGMGLALVDRLTGSGWRHTPGRVEGFLEGPAAHHCYLVAVGVGWSFARSPLAPGPTFERLAPHLRWLAWDGYGFHQGFFAPRRHIEERRISRRASVGYARRGHDQGVGRSLWFVEGADPDRIAAAIEGFAADRRADLWAGVGLAAAYAGGLDAEGLAHLRDLAGEHRWHLAQGVGFATEARTLGRETTPWLDPACRVLAGCSAEETVEVVRTTGSDLPTHAETPAATRDGAEPGYEVWRRRIREELRRRASEVRPAPSPSTPSASTARTASAGRLP